MEKNKVLNKRAGACLLLLLSWQALLSQKVKSYSIQPDTLVAMKVACECDFKSYKINIKETKETVLSNPDNKVYRAGEICNYNYLGLYKATDQMKINLVSALLSFKGDSTPVCLETRLYSVKKTGPLQSRTYPIQVDALFHINFICFSRATPIYSPCPVLYDTVTNEEINYNNEKLAEVYAIYEKWFANCKSNHFKNYSFPLSNTRYRWKYGSTYPYKLASLPSEIIDPLTPAGSPKVKPEFTPPKKPGD
jgi:hypothetical protein